MDSSGTVIFNQSINSKAGLNYLSYNFTANAGNNVSKQIRKGENNTYYLKPGKFSVQLVLDEIRVEKVMELLNE